MISFVILTYNEQVNLPRCLRSISWSDDVLVIDSGSNDGTVEIARNAGARVMERAFDSFARQRNFAMEQGAPRHRWVFHLDADEEVPPALGDELRAIAARQQIEFPVYRVPSRTLFMGTWLRRAGQYPAYQVRFGLADSLRFIDYGHGQRETQPPHLVGTLSAALDHHNFSKGSNDWFARHLRYARAEAEQSLLERNASANMRGLFAPDPTARRRSMKQLAYRLPMRPFLRFFYVYLVRLGFMDGRAGFHYAMMMSIYQYFIGLNELELRKNGNGPAGRGAKGGNR